MKKVALYILVAGTLLCSCNKTEFDETFLENNNFSLSSDGKEVLSFDDNNCQVAYNESRKEFRVFNDTMSMYYMLVCTKTLPLEEGQRVTADLVYTDGKTVTDKYGLNFKVMQTASDGRLWLWCKSKNISLTVQILE